MRRDPIVIRPYDPRWRARAYAALKRELAAASGADPNRRGAYRQGKAPFIEEVTAIALGAPGTII